MANYKSKSWISTSVWLVVAVALLLAPRAHGCAVGNAGPGCTACPISSYSLAGATVCTSCPSGQTCPIASVGPDACHPIGALVSSQNFTLSPTFSGVFAPGTYSIDAAATANALAQLNCQASSASTFLFVIGGALAINANVTTFNGSCSVTWQVTGSVSLANNVTLDGDVTATGSVTTGTGATIVGSVTPNSASAGVFTLSATFSGTLEPGTYTIGAAASAASAVLLDCQYSASSSFTFVIGGALSLNYNVTTTTPACIVSWEVNGAVTIGALTIGTGLYVAGNIAATGAIILGANSYLSGTPVAGGLLTLGTGASFGPTTSLASAEPAGSVPSVLVASSGLVLPASFAGPLNPGTYTSAASAVANLAVQLNCQGQSNAVFSFIINGALSFNANALLTNGNGLVHWAVTGAVTIAAGFSVVGDIDATGAITLGAGASLLGCARSGGALTLGAGATTLCSSTLSLSTVVGCPVGNAAPGCLPCPISSYSLAGATHCTSCPSGQTCPIASVSADACFSIASSSIANSSSLFAKAVIHSSSTALNATISGLLMPGSYSSSAATAINAPVQLNCELQNNATFYFAIGGALNIGANVTISNGFGYAQWIVNGAVTIGSGLTVAGDVVATGAITLGANATLLGVAQAGGALTLGLGASVGSPPVVAAVLAATSAVALVPTAGGGVLPSVLPAVLYAGAYTSGAATAASVPVTLDCQGALNAVFSFIIGGALAFNADVQLSNGNGLVTWSVDGAVILGTNVTVDGSVTATGAITLLPFAELNGCAQAGGALTIGASASILCTQVLSIAAVQAVSQSLQFASSASAATAGCPVGNAAPGCLPCPIGSYSLAGDTHCTSCPSGQTCPIASVSPAACTPIASSSAVGASIALASTVSGTLTPGSYQSGAALAVNVPLYLNCQNRNNAAFIFVIGGALSLNANATRANGTCSVHWQVAGAITIAAHVTADGDMDATGAIVLGTGATLNGHARAVGGVTLGSGASTGAAAAVSAPLSLASSFPLPPVFSGDLIPGTYTISAAAVANLPVQLDCQGSQSAVFTFVIGGALSLNANATLTNGNGQVTWSVDGAVYIAAGISVDGNIDAVGAIVVLAGATLSGCPRSGAGTVIGINATSACAAVLPAATAQSLHAALASTYAIPAAAGCPVGNAGPGCTPCPIGSYSLAGASHCTQCPSSQTCPIASVSADACHSIASTAALSLGAISLNATLSGSLTPNTYYTTAALAINTPLQLNCQNQSTTPFLFLVGGALSFNANVSQINGSCNIQYEVSGAASLAAGVFVSGSISASGAIGLGAGAQLSGQATAGGALTLGAGASIGSSNVASLSIATTLALPAVFSGNFTPATYTCASAAAANLNVQLDCQGSTNAVFTFIIIGALSLNANVQLINGNGKVQWTVTGAASIAAGFSVDGNIEATGAISLGANATLNGCARSGGLLSLGAGASVLCASQLSTPLVAQLTQAAISTLPTASDGCAVGNAGPGCTACPIGSYSLAGATHCTQCPSGQTCPIASVSSSACTPIGVTSALSAASISLNSTMAGVFPPGSYSTGAALAINTPVQLDCQGQSTSSFFFTIGGALSVNADVSLINGACSVSWSVAGAATIAAGISLTGSVSATGAITLGAGSSISGFAQSVGAVTLGSGASVGSVSSSISPSSLLMATTLALPAVFSGNFTPATYTCASAAAANLDVQLDCQGSTNAVFTFIIIGALSLNANVQLINGNGKVQWSVTGAASIAAGFSVDGNIEATGAISLGANATLNGCARSGGLLSLGAGASVLCADQLSAALVQQLQSASSAAVFGLISTPCSSSSGYSAANMATVGFIGLGLILILLVALIVMCCREHQKTRKLHEIPASSTSIDLKPLPSSETAMQKV